MTNTGHLGGQALYAKLEGDRSPYVRRAERAAELTVPHLFPKEGTSGHTNFVEPNQSLGARGLRHLASKLQNALFPVNAPFFKHEIDTFVLEKMEAAGARGEVEEALSAREKAVMSVMGSSMFRPTSFEVFRQLLLAGNALLYIPRKGRVRMFRLSSYVVERDSSGNLLRIVVKEKTSRAALPQSVLDQIDRPEGQKSEDRDELSLFTVIDKVPGKERFNVWQEINDIRIEGEFDGSFPTDKLPWLPLRFTAIEGEDYGRGFIEEYLGDLTNLDKLNEAVRDGTVQAAKVVWLVRAGSTTKPQALSRAPNGAFVQGNADDVVPLRLEKHADFAVAERLIESITERLAYAFMLHSAVTRQAERVTAEEIRFVAHELDEGMGGVYSLLAEEFQMPVALLFSTRMEHERKVPPLPKEITNTTIVTGIDALGRGNDLQNLDAFLAGASQIGGPDAMMRYLNLGEYYKRRGAALGIDMQGLIKSEAEIQQEEQQAQLMAMAQHLGPQAINQMGGMAQQQMQQEGEANE